MMVTGEGTILSCLLVQGVEGQPGNVREVHIRFTSKAYAEVTRYRTRRAREARWVSAEKPFLERFTTFINSTDEDDFAVRACVLVCVCVVWGVGGGECV
jgi:hypothetical protein